MGRGTTQHKTSNMGIAPSPPTSTNPLPPPTCSPTTNSQYPVTKGIYTPWRKAGLYPSTTNTPILPYKSKPVQRRVQRQRRRIIACLDSRLRITTPALTTNSRCSRKVAVARIVVVADGGNLNPHCSLQATLAVTITVFPLAYPGHCGPAGRRIADTCPPPASSLQDRHHTQHDSHQHKQREERNYRPVPHNASASRVLLAVRATVSRGAF